MSRISDEPIVSAWPGPFPVEIGGSSSAPAWAGLGVRVSPQSGLPLRWSVSGPLKTDPAFGRSLSLMVKRAMDIVLSLLALVFLAPALLGVALGIRATTRGSVLFAQDRVGQGGRLFRTYKFRTMHADLSDPTGRQQTRKNDDRITPFGRFLRRFSIDELPQLINVLRGDMSLIGPRPHVPDMLAAGVPYEELVPYYALRYQMKPGLSGWAQANGYRGPTDNATFAKARINHDIAYIQNFSLALDIWIIVLTLKAEFTGGSGV